MRNYDSVFRWLVIGSLVAMLFWVMTGTAHALCQMITVIDPVTGMVKTCTQCCEAGMCTVVCN
jgi:hypothetical protein